MTTATTARPNILLVMTDQQRSDTLGAAGNGRIQTPGLDRLCCEGVRFARAYTESPVCVSARAVVMTGLLPHRNGVFDNGYPLAPNTPTLMSRLRAAGYATQAIGKMHFTPPRQPHGFERLWLSEEIPAGVAEDDFLRDLHREGYAHVEEPHGVRHELYYVPQVSQLPERLHTTAWTARRTVEFLEGRRDIRGAGQPFFCWTSFIKPHPPFDPPAPWYRLYRATDMPLPVRDEAELDWQTYYHRAQNRFKWTDRFPDVNLLRAMKAYYYASISFVDAGVGLILDALERFGLRRDTLVLFVSDHGEYLGDHYAFGKRGYHDAAARIPFVVSWPGALPMGEVRTALVGLEDVAPTLLAAAGLAPSALGLDGLDLLTVARDPARPTRPYLFGQLGERALGLYLSMDARWKYIFSAPDQREILLCYDTGGGDAGDAQPELRDDAGDTTHRGTLERLRGAIVERFRRDGYHDPLDGAGEGWRPGAPSLLPWERLDEFEDKDIVGRGWQYAEWTHAYPVDARGPTHAAYRFVAGQPEGA